MNGLSTDVIEHYVQQRRANTMYHDIDDREEHHNIVPVIRSPVIANDGVNVEGWKEDAEVIVENIS